MREPPALSSSGLQRRLYLKRSLLLAAGAVWPGLAKSAASTQRDLLLGGGRFRPAPNQPMHFVLALADPAQGQVQTIETDFFPHSVAFSPTRQSLLYSFEKIGKGAALIDLDAKAVVKNIPPVKQRLFYGHGACSGDNQYLFSTETSPDGQGAIGIRDPKTLEYLGDFPSYGMNPHECRLVENDKVLMVSNGGGTSDSSQPGALCYIDIATQKLLQRAEMPDPRFNTGHLYPLGQRQALVISAPRQGLDETHPGTVSAFTGQGSLQPARLPPELQQALSGEALSIAVIAERDLFIVTHPTPGLLSFWSISTLQYRGHMPLPYARGVALAADRQSVWISYGQHASIRRLDLDSLRLSEQIAVAESAITGSHLVNLALL
ncbi:MAG: DUF1513 domain-containing protein [Gammaproteobacteria bacterium]|nr:DUF1513 domain-containing protein [Gammaproteobacteria bacterium]